ncbi:MAG: nuclear transport factor 2 family protein [Planctomycetota bacterium]
MRHAAAVRLLFLCSVLAVLTCTSCSTAPIDRTEVQAVLDTQAAAWNRGDLEGFMATYWRSDALSFVGSRGLTRGYDATLANYRRGYPDAQSRGHLDFELLDVRALDAVHALVIGAFHLRKDPPADGYFTLIVERRPEGLRIVHDHSSAAAPAPRAQ